MARRAEREAVVTRADEMVLEAVRDATAASRAVRIIGGGGWAEAHAAITPDAIALPTRATAGIRAYEPDDLTITVGAGTTLAELDAATHPHRQFCPLAPPGTDDATIGAVLATGIAGPTAATWGRPRDLTLGVTVIDGHAREIRAGGRVVKNVAGFDLTRLTVGAFGTLGVIVEASLRLRALPAVDESWLLTDADAAAFASWRRGPYAPVASAALDEGTLVRIAGNATFVAAARAALRACGTITSVDPRRWHALRASHPRALPPLAWSPLAARVKTAFDPAHTLNRGLVPR
ncbi:MAG: FAD-binding protein [Gemmatimonadaceae bacterium]|nr:FAD-binding protein [Gemmatimonadaceae bacterium]